MERSGIRVRSCRAQALPPGVGTAPLLLIHAQPLTPSPPTLLPLAEDAADQPVGEGVEDGPVVGAGDPAVNYDASNKESCSGYPWIGSNIWKSF